MCPRGSTSAAQKLQKTRGAQVTGRGACTPNTLTPPQPTPTQKQTTRKKTLGRFTSKLGARRPRDGHMATARRIIIIKKNKIK